MVCPASRLALSFLHAFLFVPRTSSAAVHKWVKQDLKVHDEKCNVAAQLRLCYGTLEKLQERRGNLVAYLQSKSMTQRTAYRYVHKIIMLAFPEEKPAADLALKVERQNEREIRIKRVTAMLRARHGVAASVSGLSPSEPGLCDDTRQRMCII